MIPRAFITHWRSRAPWALDEQVEQDLVISRAIVEIFSDIELGEALAFRGGTALHKVILPAPLRYSEDIDLVRTAGHPHLHALRAPRDEAAGALPAQEGARPLRLRRHARPAR